jgi:multidrug efflux system membrane fusion protein
MTARAPTDQDEPTHVRPNHTIRRRLVMALAAVAVIGAAIVAWRSRNHSAARSGASPAASAEGRIIPVSIATAAARDVPVYLDGLGNAQPLATVTVKSQVDGRLDKVSFREGQTVKKGDLLAQIDPRPFTIALHQAEAALMRDTAQLRNANLNLERFRELLARHLIAQQQLDDQQASVDQLEGTVKGDHAQVDNARLQLDYSHIRAPIDGTTGVRLVDPGNLVHVSDTTGIVVITQLDPMAVVFTLPQDDLARVSKQFAEEALVAEAYSRDGATRLATGRLELIDNQVNQATATIRLKAIFPNADKKLWPSAFLKVRLLLVVEKNALAIPAAAVQRGPQGTFVYVVAKDQTAAMRPVELGATVDQVAIVSKGLAAGEQVVIEGQNQLKPGAKVAPRPAPGPGQP